LLRSDDIDFIISDWIMPEMTGIEFLRACKEDETIKNIPFVMVTAQARKDSVLEAIKSGVDNYVVKPFTPEKPKDVISKTMAKFGR
jgi:two-component system, chemotaxis family, chemotaxis protein CheY